MRRIAPILIMVLACCTGVLRAQSGGAWIDAIPEPQRAIEKISGKDELDTKSRQGAAIHEIARVILRLSGNEFRNPPRMTAREQALHKQYTDFYQEFSMEYTNRLNRGLSPERLAELGNQRPSAPFANLEYAYRISATFQHQTFTTVMGEEWVTRWYEPLVERDRRIVANAQAQFQADTAASQARQRELNENALISLAVRVLGLPLFVIGVIWWALSWRSVPTDPADPMRLTGRGRAWSFRPVTGFASDIRVYTVQTRHTTVKRHNDFRPDEVSTHTTSRHHCEFFINAPDRKHPVHLTDAGLQVGDGHLVSCVWPVRDNGKSRGMILALNHDTTQRSVFTQSIGRLIGPRFLPGVLASIGVGLMMYWPMGLMFLLIYLVVFWVMGVIRVRGFTKRDLPRIIDRLNQDAAGVSPIMGVR